jgi:GH24 family phage-related lysozyme (muramidase)
VVTRFRRLSDRGLTFIARWEGFRSCPYKPVPSETWWTVGYGHYGPDVDPTKCVTLRWARRQLRRDTRAAASTVRRYVKVRLNQNQFDALVSFTFNVGSGAFRSSTLLRKLNEKKYRQVPDEMERWVRDGNGNILEGLVRRRAAEIRWFTREG